MRRSRRAAAAALLALTLLTACGGDGDPSVAPPTPATPTGTAAGPAPGTGPGTAAASLPAGCASPAAAPAGATVLTATVRGGSVTPPSRRYDVPLGTPVRLVLTTDTADEVHVHGYDLRAKTAPGCPTVVDLRAEIHGSVEVELESSHLELLELRSR